MPKLLEALCAAVGISVWEMMRYIGEEIANVEVMLVLQGYRRSLYSHTGIPYEGHFNLQQRMLQHDTTPDCFTEISNILAISA